MEAAKPLVQRHRLVSEIYGEKPVVQIVEIVIRHQSLFLFRHQFVEARMAEGRACTGVEQVEYRVYRVGWNNPVKQRTGEIEQMLQGMHGKPRPRADIDVLVMQVVACLVQWFPVNQSMYPVEVRHPQENDEHHQQNEIHRTVAPANHRNLIVCVQPQRNRFPGGPDHNSQGKAPGSDGKIVYI